MASVYEETALRVLVVVDRFVPAVSRAAASANRTGRVHHEGHVPPKPPVYYVQAVRGRPADTGTPREALVRRCVTGVPVTPDPGWV